MKCFFCLCLGKGGAGTGFSTDEKIMTYDKRRRCSAPYGTKGKACYARGLGEPYFV